MGQEPTNKTTTNELDQWLEGLKKKEKGTDPNPMLTSILKHTNSNHNQSTGTPPPGDGHSRTKCIKYNCPEPANCEAKTRTSKGPGTTTQYEAGQETNTIQATTNSNTRSKTPTRNNNTEITSLVPYFLINKI